MVTSYTISAMYEVSISKEIFEPQYQRSVDSKQALLL